MVKSKKKIYLILLSVIMLLLSSLPLYEIKEARALSWDPVKWILCGKEKGEAVLKAQRTDYIEFIKYSKSAIGNQDGKFDISNSILQLSGYGNDDTSKVARNPFDVMLFSGLTFSSYRGEFKYYLVDPCSDAENQESVATNFGQFYEDRKEPLTTSSERASTLDVRTKVYNEGFWSAFIKSMTDRLANAIFFIAKLIVSITLALISFSLTDLSEVFGIGQGFQEDMFLKFYNGLFVPLVVIMFLFTAGYLAYHGLVKKSYRQALSQGLLKTILCFVAAIALSLNPSWISIPNKVATTGQAIVISAMSGGFESNGTSDLCTTEVGFEELGEGDSRNYLDKTSEGLRSIIGCRMWSEFLLKPFVLGQFGAKYEDLEELNNVNSKWVGEPKMELGEGNEKKNWGLFYVSTMSPNHKALDGQIAPNVGAVNRDYYRIVDALSNYDENFYLNENQQKMGEKELTEKDSKLVTDEELKTSEIDYTKGYVEVQDNTPLDEWTYFIGNHNGNRIAYASIAALYAIIGSLPPLSFAMSSIVYGLSLSLLVIFAPIFLLLGCWGGRGNSIFMQYLGTLVSITIKRIVSAGLLFLSILLVSNAMDLVSEAGFFTSLLFLIVIVMMLLKNKDKIISQLSNVNMPQMNTEPVNKIKNMGKNVASTTGNLVGGAVAGAVATKSLKGAASGMEEAIRNEAYKTKIGRTANAIYETKAKGMARAHTEPRHCIECGVELNEDDIVYINTEGSYVCYDCASKDSFKDLKEIAKDNIIDGAIEMADKDTDVPIERKDEKTGERKIEKLRVMSYDNMRDLGYYSNDDTILKANKEKAIKKIHDTKEILELQLDNKRKISKISIPEPLQDRVNPLEIARLAKAGNTAQVKNILISACNDIEADIVYRTQEDNSEKEGKESENTKED